MTEAVSGAAASDPSNTGSGSQPIARRRGLLWVIAALVVLGAVWFLVHLLEAPQAKPSGPQAVPVGVTHVAVGNLDVYLDGLGIVTPVYTVTVASRVAGELKEIHYQEGQIVRRNELLAVIDPRPYQAALQQARGQLDRDQALLKNARIDLARYQGSFKEHAIAEQQVATQQALVDQDQGTVKLDQGNVAAAEVNVAYTRIVSPIAGRVGLRTVDPGNIVPANGTTGLVTVTQLAPITVIFTLAEDSIEQVFAQMNTGQPLRAIALDRAKQHVIATGTLITLDNQVNTSTGTVRARATFENAHDELFPNQFVNARLLVKTLTQVCLVPQGAVQHNNDLAFVYVVPPDGKVQSRPVQILAAEAETAAVTGVNAGDVLVIDGFDKLQNGTLVAARAAPAGGAAAAASAAEGSGGAAATGAAGPH